MRRRRGGRQASASAHDIKTVTKTAPRSVAGGCRRCVSRQPPDQWRAAAGAAYQGSPQISGGCRRWAVCGQRAVRAKKARRGENKAKGRGKEIFGML